MPLIDHRTIFGNADARPARGETRQAVTPNRESLPLLESVSEISRSDLQQTRRALGNAFNEADDPGPYPKDICEKQGERANCYLAAKIIQQANQAQDLDIAIETLGT